MLPPQGCRVAGLTNLTNFTFGGWIRAPGVGRLPVARMLVWRCPAGPAPVSRSWHGAALTRPAEYVILTNKILGEIMAGYATTKLSSRGQVVIPEEIRKALGLSEGDQFVVIGAGDAVILKTITPPRMDDFPELLAEARAQAKRAGIRKADLKAAIARVRRQARRR